MVGKPFFTPRTVTVSSRNHARPLRPGSRSRRKRATAGPMGSIAGCWFAVCRCVTRREPSSSGTAQIRTSMIASARRKL